MEARRIDLKAKTNEVKLFHMLEIITRIMYDTIHIEVNILEDRRE